MSELPERINRLRELAENLIWVWKPEARELFKKLDHPAWVSTDHNPVRMLQIIPNDRLQATAQDPSFLKRYDTIMYMLDQQIEEETWFSRTYPEFKGKIAYLSTEFGMHQSLPIYSGGLGILSGDHVKESSDLGIPFYALGFVYPQGYFKQVISQVGWQEAEYEDLQFSETPINPLSSNGTDQLIIRLEYPAPIYLRVWKLKVGRNNLFLMDTDIEENKPWDRGLSARLYGGDKEMRIRQEIVLGFGSLKILEHLGIEPSVYHLNEGHTSFATLELLRKEIFENGKDFEEAKRIVRDKNVFTTHTPVPAGHDQFSFELIDKYFHSYWTELGISREDFYSLGTYDWGQGSGSRFNMTALGIRMSRYQNAVSKLNGMVSNKMWEGLFNSPEFQNRPKIQYITNGVHAPTWISGPFQKLFKKYLGKNWVHDHDDVDRWEKVEDIPDEELWKTRDHVRQRMFSFLREEARTNRSKDKKNASQTLASGALLDPHALTIGFARRFATYKRAHLIFRDLKRLMKSLLDPYTPVQIIFAGKAHPQDEGGKRLLQSIYQHAIDPEFGGRVAFLENYDMQIARYLVSGCDVWLNTPDRPMEASGTSGMKSAMNGGINFSILDGWIPEAYNGSNGWVIGEGDELEDQELQDEKDATSLYRVLEQEIRPLFYRRDSEGIPEEWLEVVRNSIKTTAPQFSARRMVKQYVQAYLKDL